MGCDSLARVRELCGGAVRPGGDSHQSSVKTLEALLREKEAAALGSLPRMKGLVSRGPQTPSRQ